MSKIVVADDDRVSRNLLASMVESLGHVAIQCSDGNRAYHALEDNPDIELMITDMVMPNLSGRQLVEQVRGCENCRTLPILIVSGAVGPKAISDLLAAGATAFLGKPVNGHLLQKFLEENLEA